MAAASKEAVVGPAGDTDSGMSSIVYSTLKRVVVVGVIYFVGYMDWSVAWLITPLIFSVMRDQWKKKSELSRSIAIASAQANEKDVILAKITDLPSWVYFPDVERCEWVNRVSFEEDIPFFRIWFGIQVFFRCVRSFSNCGPMPMVTPVIWSKK